MPPDDPPPLFEDATPVAQTITEIKPQPRNPNRLAIKVGRKRVATLSIHVAARLNLAVGQVWDKPTQSRVQDAAQYDKTLAAALTLLNRRPYSTRDLRVRLRRKGHPAESIDQAVAYLTDRRLLDDAALGRELIRQLTARGPAGPRLLRTKLFQRGLPDKLIQSLLDEADEHAPPSLDPAIQFARRKLHQMAKLDPHVRRRRLWAALARKGYDSDTIETIVHAAGNDPIDAHDAP